jgi:uncharacterized NAD-dependent epimerase/dehydratase family protein
VLCHRPGREHMRGLPGRALPDLEECLQRNLEAARLTSPDVRAAGICLNTSGMETGDARRLCDRIADRLDLPTTDPIAFGVGPIIELLCLAHSAPSTIASL